MTLQYIRVTDLNTLQNLIKLGKKLYFKRPRRSVGFEYLPISNVFDFSQEIYFIKDILNINGININAPLIKSELISGKTYYIASLTRPNNYFTAQYKPSNDTFNNYLDRGCVFETAQDAQSYIIALNNYSRS